MTTDEWKRKSLTELAKAEENMDLTPPCEQNCGSHPFLARAFDHILAARKIDVEYQANGAGEELAKRCEQAIERALPIVLPGAIAEGLKAAIPAIAAIPPIPAIPAIQPQKLSSITIGRKDKLYLKLDGMKSGDALRIAIVLIVLFNAGLLIWLLRRGSGAAVEVEQAKQIMSAVGQWMLVMGG